MKMSLLFLGVHTHTHAHTPSNQKITVDGCEIRFALLRNPVI